MISKEGQHMDLASGGGGIGYPHGAGLWSGQRGTRSGEHGARFFPRANVVEYNGYVKGIFFERLVLCRARDDGHDASIATHVTEWNMYLLYHK